MMLKINSYNEWDPLEEVIVGIANNAQSPHKDKGQMAVEFPDCENPSELPTGPFSKRLIEETEEDLDKLAKTLEEMGIKVRRPQETDHSKWFSTPDWKSDGFYNYCPRDVLLVVGDTIIEPPMTMRCRYFEPYAYRDLLIEYFENGAKWVSAPKPRLLDNTYNTTNKKLLAPSLE